MSSANTQLIRTKLSPPRQSISMVSRPRLLEALQRHLDKTLIVIRAPAGYGKTSLLLQLRKELSSEEAHLAWCTLDDGDNNESQFFIYLVAAFKAADCDVGDGALAAYQHGAEAASRAFIAVLVNELAAFGDEIYLFLDDFQCIADKGILAAMEELVRYAPHNLHIVMASKTMPALPFMELELHDMVGVIDIDQMRFNFDEARQFIRVRTGSSVSEEDIHRLCDFTEGWAAGLQLATISVNKGMDAKHYVKTFHAKENELDRFFANAVFERFPADVKRFLMFTSILSRFNVDLAEAVTENKNTAEMLRTLYEDNIFLCPLTGDKGWSKYHQLFAEFLRKRLQHESDVDIEGLYRKASEWSEKNGYLLEAVYYALEGNLNVRAAELVESCALGLIRTGELKAYLSLLDRLPVAELDSRPSLRVALCWALVLSNAPAKARELIERLERQDGLDEHTREHIQILRAVCDLYEENFVALDRGMELWRKQSAKQDPFLTSVGCNLLSINLCHHFEYEKAREVLIAPKTWSDQERGYYSCYYASCFNAYSYVRQGYVKVAEPVFRSMLQRANHNHGRRSAPACTVASFYNEVLYETCQFDTLKDVLQERLDVIDLVALPEALLGTYISKSRLQLLEGDFLGAKETLERLQLQSEQRGHMQVLAGCISERVSIHLHLDEYHTARELYKSLVALSGAPASISKGGVEQLKLLAAVAGVRIHVYEGKWEMALALVEAQLAWLRETNQYSRVIQLELIKGRVLNGMGRTQEALVLLDGLLRQGEQLGLIRVFADEWPYCKNYLKSPDKNGLTSASRHYIEKVLNGFLKGDEATVEASNDVGSGAPGLIEELSARESDVLEFLAQGLQNKQIANLLNISVDTVKWHLKSLYAKLDVSQRGKAVSKARKLGIL